MRLQLDLARLLDGANPLDSAFQPDSLSNTPVLGIDDVETAYYLRMQVSDKPGVMADIARILGDAGISIEAMQQKEPAPGETQVPLVMLTQSVSESQMNAALGEIEALDSVAGEVTRIRVEQLN